MGRINDSFMGLGDDRRTQASLSRYPHGRAANLTQRPEAADRYEPGLIRALIVGFHVIPNGTRDAPNFAGKPLQNLLTTWQMTEMACNNRLPCPQVNSPAKCA